MCEFTYQLDKINDNLYFIGKVNIKSVNELHQELHKLEKEKSNNTDKTVKLFVTSSGGDVYQGLKLVDILQNTTLELIIYFSGFVGSAATYAAFTKHKVKAYKNTILGFHELSDNTNHRYSNVVASMHCSNILMDKIVAIYNTKSDVITKEWLIIDKFLTADEALEMKIVDEVI